MRGRPQGEAPRNVGGWCRALVVRSDAQARSAPGYGVFWWRVLAVRCEAQARSAREHGVFWVQTLELRCAGQARSAPGGRVFRSRPGQLGRLDRLGDICSKVIQSRFSFVIMS